MILARFICWFYDVVTLKFIIMQVTPFINVGTQIGIVYIETKLEITWKLIIDVMLSARAVV